MKNVNRSRSGGPRAAMAGLGALCLLAGGSMLACAPADQQPAAGSSAASAPYPDARGYTQLVFHPPSGRFILIGGESNHRTALEDTWAWDAASDEWSELQADPHPENAEGRAAAYDAESNRIIVHFTTRLDRSAPGGLTRMSETWAFDVATATWTDMQPDPAPFGLMGARMVYDAAADRIILFGGGDFTQNPAPRFNETWAYDFNTNTWSQRHPDQRPPGRSYFGMAWDADARKSLIFGGSLAAADSAAAGEMWAYDYASDHWERLAYSGNAPSDHHPAMVYAPGLRKSLYLVNQSFYAFDYEARSWTDLGYDPALGVRHFHGMAFDPHDGRLVVFGGGSQGLQYDNLTWTWDPSSNEWHRAGPPE